MAFDRLRRNGFGFQFAQSPFELFGELVIGPLDAALAADQDMVGAGDPRLRKDRPGERAQAALHPVADHRIADLLRNGEAEAEGGIAVAARADEKHETGHGRAQTAVRGQEVRAAVQLADGGRI